MSSVPRLDRPSAPEAPALHARAMDNLRFIRETMERAGAFTAVSGWGMCATGLLAVGAAVAAGSDPTSARWLQSWFIALAGSVLVSGWATVRKARAARMPLLTGPGRKFLLGFSPPMLVGALLTVVLVRAGEAALLPGAWLLLYGTPSWPRAPSRCASSPPSAPASWSSARRRSSRRRHWRTP